MQGFIFSWCFPQGVLLPLSDSDWDNDLYEYHTAVVDSLSPHPNILGFVFAFDDTITNSTSDSLTFIKARIRDIKAHIKSNNYNETPIGIVESGDDSRPSTTQFLRCGATLAFNEELVDFLLISDQFDCSEIKLEPPETILKNRTKTFQDYGIPLLSIGSRCGTSTSDFSNYSWVAPLFSPQSSPIWSGGVFDDWYMSSDGTGALL